jgi:hypothetical protein
MSNTTNYPVLEKKNWFEFKKAIGLLCSTQSSTILSILAKDGGQMTTHQVIAALPQSEKTYSNREEQRAAQARDYARRVSSTNAILLRLAKAKLIDTTKVNSLECLYNINTSAAKFLELVLDGYKDIEVARVRAGRPRKYV